MEKSEQSKINHYARRIAELRIKAGTHWANIIKNSVDKNLAAKELEALEVGNIFRDLIFNQACCDVEDIVQLMDAVNEQEDELRQSKGATKK